MAFTIHWPRVLRRSLQVFAAIVGIVVLAWFGLAWYINANKEEIQAKVSSALGKRLRGDLQIGSMEPSMFRSFPDISLVMNDVRLQDSLWNQHRHSLLECRNLFVRINPVALLSRRVEINKIIAAHGSIFLFTDTAGYSNTYLLERRDTNKTNRTALVKQFGAQDMHFWFVNEMKQKRFHLLLKNLNGSATRDGDVMHFQSEANAHVYEFAFSLARGSYLRNQDLSFNLGVSYHISDKHLHIPEQLLNVSGTPLGFGGDFHFNTSPSSFAIHLSAKDVPYKTALAWASDNIQRTLRPYNFEKPVSMDVKISGVMKYRTIPLIRITYPIVDNTLITPLGNLEHISYSGVYSNEVYGDRLHTDDNSTIALYGLSATWRGIPFQSDTLAVVNLLRPVVKAHIRSKFPVASLQNVISRSVMSFERGTASADLHYAGGILPDDTTAYSINGYVRVADAGLTYHPRNLILSNVGATLLFQNDNLFFRAITIRSKQSSVSMEGDALHILRLYFSDPGKVAIAWRMRGALINLNDFIGFAAKRKSGQIAHTQQSGASNAVTRISNQLDRVLESAGFALDARVDRMMYKSFDAQDVIAQLSLNQQNIQFQKVQIRNGGGALNISGFINQAAPNNPFRVKALVSNADVSKLFSSFDNFGQTAISTENLAGSINVDADISGNVTDAGAILKNSFNGSVSFNLKDGQIRHFQPFEKVGKVVFKKRNLADVTVKDLQGRLDISGSKIMIRPMKIQTSALNMNVQGVYGLAGGTDISIEVPLRNPEKEGANTPLGMLLRTGKGIVLHLRAQDPTGDGVKIGWDPLRHGKKATNATLNESP